MSTRQKRKSRINGLIVPGLCLSLLFYFAYHAQTGRYSIYTKEEMRQEAKRLERQLEELRDERSRLRNRVTQLTVGTLERDALDEVARSQLGYVGDDELIIFY
ncbi:FtsB family cell division protein [Salaquimonas pukyongi]|uniref:FtsB family cell division protein n=1 Tax=Salaquimonas pukyongi TaxID=2712698 RepID=UPI00096BB3C3|nr:septum formation initiator family protein [Salaquimonas pukyongi]